MKRIHDVRHQAQKSPTSLPVHAGTPGTDVCSFPRAVPLTYVHICAWACGKRGVHSLDRTRYVSLSKNNPLAVAYRPTRFRAHILMIQMIASTTASTTTTTGDAAAAAAGAVPSRGVSAIGENATKLSYCPTAWRRNTLSKHS